MQRGETVNLKLREENRWRQEVTMGEEAVHKGNLKMGFLCLRACAYPPIFFFESTTNSAGEKKSNRGRKRAGLV